MLRYLKGLLAAFLLFGLAFFATSVVASQLGRSRLVSWHSLIDIWIGFGVPSLILLAAGIGPIVLGVSHAVGGTLSVRSAGLLGTVLSPMLALAVMRLYPEGETLENLFQYWLRFPGQFVLGVIPCAAATAFFAGWVASHQRRSRPQTANRRRPKRLHRPAKSDCTDRDSPLAPTSEASSHRPAEARIAPACLRQ